MRIVITGGAGFIGSCLASELLARGDEVLVYDNFAVGRPEFLPLEDSRLSVVEDDVVDYTQLLEVLMSWSPHAVIHLAALAYIPFCNAHPLETLRINVEGTKSVLEACRKAGVERVVVASSAAVYGHSDTANRESDLIAPTDIYGMSKWFDEVLLRQFYHDSGISCFVARLFNIYGPNPTNPYVIPTILKQMSTSNEIQLGNVDVYRDFVYVRDAAQALIELAQFKEAEFGVFNVGTGKEHSIREVVCICGRLIGRPLRIRSITSRRRQKDLQHLLADPTYMKETVGWHSQYDLYAGLAETMEMMSVMSSVEQIVDHHEDPNLIRSPLTRFPERA